MGLFSDPLVINDGSADRTFNFRAQLSTSKPDETAGEYIEPAADAEAGSVLVVKHSQAASKRERHLLQRVENVTINDTDETLMPIIFNGTLSCDPGHTDAQVSTQFALFLEALTETGFVAAFRRKRI